MANRRQRALPPGSHLPLETIADTLADAVPHAEQALLPSEASGRLKDLILELPPRAGQVLYLHKFEGLSYAEIGERRQVRLEDGTLVEMDAGTAFSSRYSERLRRVTLHEGQVLFTVPADPARPFEMLAEEGQLGTTGASFGLHMSSVAVAQGDVRVERAGRSVTLSNGQGARYAPSASTVPCKAIRRSPWPGAGAR